MPGWAYHVRTGKTVIPPIGLRGPAYEVVIEGDEIAGVVDWPDD